MNQPILRVKKGAELYDDEAPSGPLPDSPAPPARTRSLKGGLRQILRRGGSTFLPLVVIAIALLLVFREIPRGPGPRATLQGWDLVLRAMPYQGELLVGVTFVRSNRRGAGSAPGSEAPSGEPPTAIVKFLARETGEAVAVAEQLARSPFTVGGKLGAAQNVKNVAAEVSIGAEKTILAVAVQ